MATQNSWDTAASLRLPRPSNVGMHGLSASSTMPKEDTNEALPPLCLNDAKHALLHQPCIALLDILASV
jgi:hypothetical protein